MYRDARSRTDLCGACSGQANTLEIWLSSLILSTQNWPLGKTILFISRLPSGWSVASIAFPMIVKLSDFGQLGNPATISMADDTFGSRGGASAISFMNTQVLLRTQKEYLLRSYWLKWETERPLGRKLFLAFSRLYTRISLIIGATKKAPLIVSHFNSGQLSRVSSINEHLEYSDQLYIPVKSQYYYLHIAHFTAYFTIY